MNKFNAIVMLALSSPVLYAAGWKEDFSELQLSDKYSRTAWITDKNVRITKESSAFQAVRLQGAPSIIRYVPYDFESGDDYLRLRLTEVSKGRFLLVSQKIGQIQEWIQAKPGLYTIPVKELAARGDAKGTLDFRVFFRDTFSFNELALAPDQTADGIYFSVSDPEGKIKKSTEPATAGDTVTITMPLTAKADKLTLYLYKINTGRDWSRRGDWEAVSLPNVPLELKPSKNNPLLYQASFRLTRVPKGLTLSRGTLIAAVNYLGADANSQGFYYGICPYGFELAEGQTEFGDSSELRIFDFGPPDGRAAAGASVINEKQTAPDFHWGKNVPSRYGKGYHRLLDDLMLDWAEVAPRRHLDFAVRVKPGKYQVTVGLGGLNTMCWLNRAYYPFQATITANGVKVWEKQDGEESCYAMSNRVARKDDDVFDVYMAPFLHDASFTVDCPDGKLKMRISAGISKLPVNYLAVCPAGSKTGEQQLARIRFMRKQVFNEFWKDATPGVAELSGPLTVAGFRPEGKAFQVFPRENPYAQIFYDSFPLVSESGTLRLLTAPGQPTEGTVLLRSFRPVGNVSAVLSLPGFPGAEISFVMPYRFAGHLSGKYYIGPNHYVPAGSRNLEANCSYGYRIGFKTPENMKAGLYRGSIKFSAGEETHELPVEVRVFSRRLPELDDHIIAMCGTDGTLESMTACKELLGCNTVSLICTNPVHSKFRTDGSGFPVEVVSAGGWTPERVRRWGETYKKAGFRSRTPIVSFNAIPKSDFNFKIGPYRLYTSEYTKALELSLSMIRDGLMKHAGASDIIIDLGGEMGHSTRVPKKEAVTGGIEVIREAGKIPHVLPMYRSNCYTTGKEFYPYLAVQGVRGDATWQIVDKLSNYGKNKFLYTYSVSGRFENGVASWAHGARGNFREWLAFKHHHEFNDFLCCNGLCGGTDHFETMPGPNNTYLPTIRSDAFRAAVIDRQYLRMLENEIKSSKNTAAVKKAEAFLSLVRRQCFQESSHSSIIWQTAANPWPGMRLDLIREAVLLLIDELQGKRAVLPEFAAVGTAALPTVPELPAEKDILTAPEAKAGYPDSAWRAIRTGRTWEEQGIPYDGCAWYRKEIAVPDGWENPVLRIGAADERAWVFCNGQYLGHHDGWNEPFTMKLRNSRPGGKAMLAILVYDSSYSGGIWRSVTLHENEQLAAANKNGINLDDGWKIALRPGKRDLNVFALTDGPFVPADADRIAAKIQLFPAGDDWLKALAESEAEIKVCGLSGKELIRRRIGKIRPYAVNEFLIPLDGTVENSCEAVLVIGGREFSRVRFYRIPRWQPEK